ncbi:MAG: Crp/Fnr family transcriptional regulator [Pyrinomonadaceae bacterium]|nr:Crp/Fnr family transcriptional regulator [Pyrinomonadaceae bacterium]
MLAHDLKELFSESISITERDYRTNEFVFQQGTTAEGIFTVENGGIKIERYTSDGAVVGIHQAGAGECFAEASLFSEKYDCFAVATKPSRLTLFPKKEVLSVLMKHPETAIKYITHLSNEVKRLRTDLHLRSINSARERLLNYFLLFSDPKTKILTLPFTLKDLAGRLGLAHETVYRELRKLEQEAVIERREKHIKILNAV